MAINNTDAVMLIGADFRSAEKARDDFFRKLSNNSIKLKIDTQPLGTISRDVNAFRDSLRAAELRTVAFASAAGQLFAIQRAFQAITKATIDTEKSLTDINVVLGLSQKQLLQFSNGLFKVANETGASFKIAAEGATELSRQGLSASETLKRLKDALTLTRLSGLDVEKSVNAITAAINSFNDATLDSTAIINKLANVDAQFAVSSGDLAEALSRVGSTAKDVGVGFDELIGFVTAAKQITQRDGAVIGNALKTIFQRIQRPEVLDNLKELGVRTQDLNGQTLTAQKLLIELAKSYNTLTDAQKNQVVQLSAGVYQSNQFRAILNDLAKGNSIYQRAVEASTSATDQAARRQLELNKTLSASINQTINKLTQASFSVGEITLKPLFDKILTGLNGFSDIFGEKLDKNGEDLGNSLGVGVLKGIGNYLSGPGLALGGLLIYKLTTSFAGTAIKSLANILEQNSSRVRQEEAIRNLLAQQPQLLQEIAALQGNSVQIQQKIGEAITRNNANLNEQLKIVATIREQTVSGLGLFSNAAFVERGGIIRKKAAVGIIPALEEKVGAYAAGYTPGQVKQLSIPKLGTVYYNTAEKVKYFPGLSQPAIIPPQNSKAGINYNKSFIEQHGFSPYKAGGHIPNYVFEQIGKFRQPNQDRLKIAQEQLIKSGLFLKDYNIPISYDGQNRNFGGMYHPFTSPFNSKPSIRMFAGAPVSTYRHEYGHFIDNLMGSLQGGKYFSNENVGKIQQLNNRQYSNKYPDNVKEDFADIFSFLTSPGGQIGPTAIKKYKFVENNIREFFNQYNSGKFGSFSEILKKYQSQYKLVGSPYHKYTTFVSTGIPFELAGSLPTQLSHGFSPYKNGGHIPNFAKQLSFPFLRRIPRISPNAPIAYHGTLEDFSKFEIGDLGFHFGSKKAAKDRIESQAGRIAGESDDFNYDEAVEKAKYIRARLNFKKTLELPEPDKGFWSDPFRVIRRLYNSNVITTEEAKPLVKFYSKRFGSPVHIERGLQEYAEHPFLDEYENREIQYQDFEPIRKVLKKKGYDSIAYGNQYEDKGSLSYIAFKNSQIQRFSSGFSPYYNKGLVPNYFPQISKSQAAELLKSKQFQSLTYQKGSGETANYNAAQYRVRRDKLVGAPAPEGFKNWTQFDESTGSLVLHSIKQGEDEAKFRRFSLSGIKSIRAKGEIYDVMNKGMIPNFVNVLGSGKFGEFIDLNRDYNGYKLGIKKFLNNDFALEHEYLISKKLKELQQKLPNFLNFPAIFGSLSDSKRAGGIFKEVIPGLTGKQFVKGKLGGYDSNEGRAVSLALEMFRSATATGLGNHGILVDDLGDSNFILNSQAEKELYKFITSKKQQFNSIKTLGDRSTFFNLFKGIGNRGGQFSIIDPGLFDYKQDIPIKFRNKGLIPNFANEIVSPNGYLSYMINALGNQASINYIQNTGIGKGGAGQELYPLLFEKLRKNPKIKSVFGQLNPQNRLPLDKSTLSKLKAKYPQIIRGRYASNNEISFENSDLLIKLMGGQDFDKDLAKKAPFILMAEQLSESAGINLTSFLNKGLIPNFASKDLLKSLKSFAFPYVDYKVSRLNKDEAYLSTLEALEKGKGGGSQFMKWLTLLADAHKTNLSLTPSAFGRGGLNQQDLIKFYKKFGFSEKTSIGNQLAEMFRPHQFVGLIPNFSALSDAITRENKAGIPFSQIRIGSSPRIKSSFNPFGLGVYNTKDEPLGLNQGIARVAATGLDPKMAGIPNYVNLNDDDFSTSLPKLKKLAIGDIENIQNELRNSVITLSDALKKLNNISELSSKGINKVSSSLRGIDSYIKDSAPGNLKNSFDAANNRYPIQNSLIPFRGAYPITPAHAAALSIGAIDANKIESQKLLGGNFPNFILDPSARGYRGNKLTFDTPIPKLLPHSDPYIATGLTSKEKIEEQQLFDKLASFNGKQREDDFNRGQEKYKKEILKNLSRKLSNASSEDFDSLGARRLIKEASKSLAFNNDDIDELKSSYLNASKINKNFRFTQQSEKAFNDLKFFSVFNPFSKYGEYQKKYGNTSAAQLFNSRFQNTALGAQFALPVIGGIGEQVILDSGLGNSRQGRAGAKAFGALGNVGSFALLGATLAPGPSAPIGAGIGAGIGILSSLPSVLKELNNTLPDLQRSLESVTESTSKTSNAFNSFITSTEGLLNIQQNGGTVGQKRALERQNTIALSKFSPSTRAKVLAANGDLSKIADIASLEITRGDLERNFITDVARLQEKLQNGYGKPAIVKSGFSTGSQLINDDGISGFVGGRTSSALASLTGLGIGFASLFKKQNLDELDKIANYSPTQKAVVSGIRLDQFKQNQIIQNEYTDPLLRDFLNLPDEQGVPIFKNISKDELSNITNSKDFAELLSNLQKTTSARNINALSYFDVLQNLNGLGQNNLFSSSKRVFKPRTIEIQKENLEKLEADMRDFVKVFDNLNLEFLKLSESGQNAISLFEKNVLDRLSEDITEIGKKSINREINAKIATFNKPGQFFENFSDYELKSGNLLDTKETKLKEIDAEALSSLASEAITSQISVSLKTLEKISQDKFLHNSDRAKEFFDKNKNSFYEIFGGKVNFDETTGETSLNDVTLDDINFFKDNIKIALDDLTKNKNDYTDESFRIRQEQLRDLYSKISSISTSRNSSVNAVNRQFNQQSSLNKEGFLGNQRFSDYSFNKEQNINSLLSGLRISEIKDNLQFALKKYGLSPIGKSNIDAEEERLKEFNGIKENLIKSKVQGAENITNLSDIQNLIKKAQEESSSFGIVGTGEHEKSQQALQDVKTLTDAYNKINNANSEINEKLAARNRLLEIENRFAEKRLENLKQQNKEKIAIDGSLGRDDLIKTAFEGFRYETVDLNKDIAENLAEVSTNIKDSFKSGFKAAALEGKNFGEAMRQVGLSIGQNLISKTIDLGTDALFGLIFSGLSNSNTGLGRILSSSSNSKKSSGGLINKYARGGFVNGGSGIIDDVPALLSGGEYVIRKSSVDKIGKRNLDAINSIDNISVSNSNGFTGTFANEFTAIGGSRKNDKYYPEKGFLNVSGNLSSIALTDENNPQNALRFARERYFYDKKIYDRQKRKALSNFENAAKQQIYITAGSALLNAGISSYSSSTAKPITTNNPQTNIGKLGGFDFNGIQYRNSYTASNGGLIPKFASGGIFGGDSISDKYPALLMGGEYVINKSAVEKYGSNFFDTVNKTGRFPKFANGGYVGNSDLLNSNSSTSNIIQYFNDLISISEEIRDGINNKKDKTTSELGVNISINTNINISSDGTANTKTTIANNSASQNNKEGKNSSITQEEAKKLSDLINLKINEAMVKESRSGGILYEKFKSKS